MYCTRFQDRSSVSTNTTLGGATAGFAAPVDVEPVPVAAEAPATPADRATASTAVHTRVRRKRFIRSAFRIAGDASVSGMFEVYKYLGGAVVPRTGNSTPSSGCATRPLGTAASISVSRTRAAMPPMSASGSRTAVSGGGGLSAHRGGVEPRHGTACAGQGAPP